MSQNSSISKRVPGEAGIWIFILGDMVIFALFFAVFVYYRGLSTPLYLRSQSTLNQTAGVINTLLLLTSSWLVVQAVISFRNALPARSAKYLSFAMFFGLGFVIVKVIEYSQKLRAGITLETNDFYMYYYMLTAIHLVHVFIGMGVLIFIRRIARAGGTDPKALQTIESGACFWHLVDVLWILLFALLYLMK